MSKITGMSVFLNVSNVEKSRVFYEGLGFKKTLEFPEMNVVGYSLGKANLLIGPADSPGDPSAAEWLKHKPWGVGAVIMPQVTNVDATFEMAKALGAEIEQPPMDMPWGSRTMSVADPDGYSIMFDQELKAARKPAKAKAAARKAPKSAARKAGKKLAKAKKR